jgi:hypothetical protein
MSTIKVNTLDSTTGTSITVPTGKTFVVTDTGALTIGGTAITTGSSNILRKTTDYTVVTGDVSGKSELVIACNAAGANRIITLPAVAAVGMSTCIITVILDADSAAANNVQVKDSGGTEVWTGIQKGDFVRLIVSNSLWLVMDHKETYFEHRYLTTNQTVASQVFEKWEATTSITSIGAMYSAADVAIIAPADGYMHINSNYVITDEANPASTAGLKIGATAGSMVTIYQNPNVGTDGRHTGPEGYNSEHSVTSGDFIELWIQNHDDQTLPMEAGLARTQYVFKFVRSY